MATKPKTNLQMLVWGIKHIAKNHHFTASTNYKEDGQVCILGCNVPTLSDVQMLAEDCKLSKDCVIEGSCGIDVVFDEDWWENYAKKPYEQPAWEFWKRVA